MKNLFNYKFSKLLGTAFVAASLFCGCQSAPKEIPDDLTHSQLIQRGQDALANGNKVAADAYFIACLDRYGEDLKCYTEARYELAHSYYVQHKYALAKKMFTEIIGIFDDPSAVYKVQPKYKKLAEIELNKIKAIEEKAKSKEEKNKSKKEN